MEVGAVGGALALGGVPGPASPMCRVPASAPMVSASDFETSFVTDVTRRPTNLCRMTSVVQRSRSRGVLLRKLYLFSGVLAFLLVVSLAVVVAFAVLGNDDADLARQARREMPVLADYSFVSLPSSPPPGAPLLRTGHNADPVSDGQQVMFQYPTFTLYACSVVPGKTDSRPCDFEGGTTIRTVRSAHASTQYVLGSKDPSDPPTDSDDLVSIVKEYVLSARFEVTPDWVEKYVNHQIEARLGQ